MAGKVGSGMVRRCPAGAAWHGMAGEVGRVTGRLGTLRQVGNGRVCGARYVLARSGRRGVVSPVLERRVVARQVWRGVFGTGVVRWGVIRFGTAGTGWLGGLGFAVEGMAWQVWCGRARIG